MKMAQYLSDIVNIKRMFTFYGFLNSPLTTKEIVNLLLKGKTKDEIYNIGCDKYCGFS